MAGLKEPFKATDICQSKKRIKAMQEGGKVGEARDKILICTTGVVALDSPQCLLLPNIQFLANKPSNKQTNKQTTHSSGSGSQALSTGQLLKRPSPTKYKYKLQNSGVPLVHGMSYTNPLAVDRIHNIEHSTLCPMAVSGVQNT